VRASKEAHRPRRAYRQDQKSGKELRSTVGQACSFTQNLSATHETFQFDTTTVPVVHKCGSSSAYIAQGMPKNSSQATSMGKSLPPCRAMRSIRANPWIAAQGADCPQ
jgi:hypothetical protein